MLCGISHPTICDADRKALNPAINTSDNRVSTADGYTFDNSGNTTRDSQNRKFTYDGENKQIKVETVDQNGIVTGLLGEYFYDGDGKRVKKYSFENSEWITTIFIYDASGKLIEEYSTKVEQSSTAKVSYLTNDHLGSPRITTDRDGQTISRRDFQPFGEEIATSQRTQGLGYTEDTVTQKFTGYERDEETQLEFAQARYYSRCVGRFISPDPLLASNKSIKPQTWNRYTYVLNNPLKLTDPSGMIPEQGQDEKKKRTLYIFVSLSEEEMAAAAGDGSKLIPDFSKLKDAGKANGIDVFIYALDSSGIENADAIEGRQSVSDRFVGALRDSNAIGVIYIGHTGGTYALSRNQEFIANELNLGGAENRDARDVITDTQMDSISGVKTSLIGLFGCDTQRIAGAFQGKDNQSKPAIIGVDSGINGLSGGYNMAQSGITAANAIISGKSPDEVTAQANKTFTSVKHVTTESKDTQGRPLNEGDSIKRIQ